MAVKKGKFTNLKKEELRDARLEWDPLLAGDSGEWKNIAGMADKTIHVYSEAGVWGGSTLTLEGSNEDGTPSHSVVLVDPQGNSISITSNAIEAILENPSKMRPVLTGGTATDIVVIIVAKGEQR